LVVCYRRFATSYRSHFQGSSSSFTAWPLKVGPIGCAETSRTNYVYTAAETWNDAICTSFPFSFIFQNWTNFVLNHPSKAQWWIRVPPTVIIKDCDFPYCVVTTHLVWLLK
jgi:hypothetical protein